MAEINPLRLTKLNEAEADPNGDYILYWMIAQRRTGWNFALQRAVDWSREFQKPLLILEALRCDYRWASDRMHRFVMQGMADNHHAIAESPATYFPYVETYLGEGKDLLEALAAKACAVVTDDFPSFFIPRMVKATADRIPVLFEQVDSNGLLPLRAAEKVFLRAVDFRRFLQKNLTPHLEELPLKKPLARLEPAGEITLPKSIKERWPAADEDFLSAQSHHLATLPIDHDVPPASFAGGNRAAGKKLREFLKNRIDRYAEDRNSVNQPATSELSPYLHFGHISTHEIFVALAKQKDWTPGRLAGRANGARHGWWGMDEAGESFLDELITWRELGYNMTWQVPNYDRYESLPEWARISLEKHENDPRPDACKFEVMDQAQTYDEVWNAAQRQLVTEGRMHNYLRMLWGKKILEWSPTPRAALDTLIELNNKYAVDGRNPNSYSGIFWCLGRYDRAWGPERPIFGKIRYMSSDNTRRKMNLKPYLAQYGPLAMS